MATLICSNSTRFVASSQSTASYARLRRRRRGAHFRRAGDVVVTGRAPAAADRMAHAARSLPPSQNRRSSTGTHACPLIRPPVLRRDHGAQRAASASLLSESRPHLPPAAAPPTAGTTAA